MRIVIWVETRAHTGLRRFEYKVAYSYRMSSKKKLRRSLFVSKERTSTGQRREGHGRGWWFEGSIFLRTHCRSPGRSTCGADARGRQASMRPRCRGWGRTQVRACAGGPDRRELVGEVRAASFGPVGKSIRVSMFSDVQQCVVV